MSNIEIFHPSGPATMSSREIAQITGKEHRNVLRDCDALNESYKSLSLLKIEQGYFFAENKQRYREYRLTKMQCLDLMTGYNTELRIKINRRWAELEQQVAGTPQLPHTYAEALRLAAAQAEKIENQQKQIEAMRQKEVYADAVAGSGRSCLIGELAKTIAQNGIEIGQNRLFQWLRANGYLCSHGDSYNLPTQRAMQMGLFEVKRTVITRHDESTMTTATTKVTGKGQVYFINKFLSK